MTAVCPFHIQQLLGHQRFETTAIYTHVSIEQLKAVHAKTHPAELRKNGWKDFPSAAPFDTVGPTKDMTSTLTNPCPHKSDPQSKNRVVGSGGFTSSCTWSTCSQTPDTHREIETTSTTTVSGALEWLSKDPIGISGGLNQYVAFGNNPVMFIDPLGLCEENVRRSGISWLDRLYPDYSSYGPWINSIKYDLSAPPILQIKDALRGSTGGWHIPFIAGEPRPDLTLVQVERMSWEQMASVIGGQTGPEFFDSGIGGPMGYAKLVRDLLGTAIDVMRNLRRNERR